MLQHDCELSEDVKITQQLVRIKQDPEADAVIKQEHNEQVTLLPHLQNMLTHSVFLFDELYVKISFHYLLGHQELYPCGFKMAPLPFIMGRKPILLIKS